MYRTKIGARTAFAAVLTALVLVVAPACANAADTGWIYTSTSSNTVNGCLVGGYQEPAYADAYEKTSCSGQIGLKSKFVSGGTYWISGLYWGNSTATVSYANTFGHRIFH